MSITFQGALSVNLQFLPARGKASLVPL